MHGVRDRYTIKRKKNNKGEELKKIVGWIWTSWRWPRFYGHCYADRVRGWKKREEEGNGERRGETREWMAITLVQTHLLTVEFWYRLICFDGGQIRHESTEEKTFDFHSILVFACFFNHPRWETLSRCPALFNIQPLIFFLFFFFLFSFFHNFVFIQTNRMLKIPIGNGNRRKKQAQFPSWTTKTINLKSPMENFNLKYIFPRS